jgi:hypothetical protein
MEQCKGEKYYKAYSFVDLKGEKSEALLVKVKTFTMYSRGIFVKIAQIALKLCPNDKKDTNNNYMGKTRIYFERVVKYIRENVYQSQTFTVNNGRKPCLGSLW